MKTPVCTILGMDSQVGFKMAQYYANKGYHIALMDWSRNALEKNQDILKQKFENVNAFIIEGTDYSDLQYAFQKVYAHLGHTEVLVYNKTTFKRNISIQSPDFFRSLRKNLFRTTYTIDQVYSTMFHHNKGEVVLIGQEFDLVAAPQFGKAFIKNLQVEFKNSNIKLIAPVKQHFKTISQTQQRAQKLPYAQANGARTPQNYRVQPSYVSNPTAY